MENKDLWFGEIPSHWTYDKIGILFSERRTKVSDKDYAPLSVARIGVVPQLATAVKTDAGDNRKLVCKGDFVINSRSDRKGSCGVADRDGSVSLINIVLTPRNEWNNKYVHYLMRSQPFSEEYYRYGRGIVADLWTTRYSEMKSILLPIPPRAEQDQIVRFLDWKVSAINRLIGIKRKEIVYLEELQRTRIADVVMGKIASGKKRNTNIGWINCIPNHWEEKSLIQVSEEQKIRNEGMAENNLLSLSYGKIVTKDINTTDGLLPANFEGYQIVHSGNVILRLTDLQNDHRSLRTGFVNQTGIITSAYTCLKTRENILPKYLQLQLHIADLCKVFYGMGGGVRQSIGFKEIRKLRIVLPPINEQMDIINSVNSIESTIEHAIKKEKNHIKTLDELKTRLIADTVTGKIDVRNIEIPYYEFAGEESQAEEEIDAEGSENEE